MHRETLLDLWNLRNEPPLQAKGFTITLRRVVEKSGDMPAFTSVATINFDLSGNSLAEHDIYRVPIPWDVPNDENSIVDYMIRILAGGRTHESH